MLLTSAAEQRSAGQCRMSAREWLGFHGVVFLIGAWNLFAVNLARTPGVWWFWMPVAAWAGVLGVHTLWYQMRGSRTVKVEPTPKVL
jgi:dolichyl-phosphate-mannose--protein O-mannosyl transferase